jgi:hypothetical protein
MNSFDESVSAAHIAELQQQLVDVTRERDALLAKVNAHPRALLDAALTVREKLKPCVDALRAIRNNVDVSTIRNTGPVTARWTELSQRADRALEVLK